MNYYKNCMLGYKRVDFFRCLYDTYNNRQFREVKIGKRNPRPDI